MTSGVPIYVKNIIPDLTVMVQLIPFHFLWCNNFRDPMVHKTLSQRLSVTAMLERVWNYNIVYVVNKIENISCTQSTVQWLDTILQLSNICMLSVLVNVHWSHFIHRLCARWLPLPIRGEPLHQRPDWACEELET